MRFVRPVDLAFAGLLALTGVLEVTLTDVAGRPLWTLLLALVASLAMLLRTAMPLVCLAILVVLVILAHMSSWGLNLTGALVVGCLFALGTVGKLCEDRQSLPAFTGTVVVFVVGAAFVARPWDVVVALVGCGTAWGAGRVLRRESERNAQLRSLAADLVAQREVRTREAVQEERLRIARELHDTVAHAVSVMTLQVGGVRRRLDSEPGKVQERDVLLEVEGVGREAVAELHRMLDVLRAPEEEDPPAEDASPAPRPGLADLPHLASRVRAAGTPVELRIDDPLPALSPGLELTGYRVVQEALTNVLKHGGDARAQVTVTCPDHRLELLVRDDGRTPAAPTADTASRGLIGIRERVALYGGQVQSGPLPDGGFEVRVSLPLPDEGA